MRIATKSEAMFVIFDVINKQLEKQENENEVLIAIQNVISTLNDDGKVDCVDKLMINSLKMLKTAMEYFGYIFHALYNENGERVIQFNRLPHSKAY